MPESNYKNTTTQTCSLVRRFAAIVYDLMLLFAVLFAATAILMPFTHGEAINSKLLYPLYLLAWSYVFYVWQWTHGGQTLGMRAWKIKLSSDSGHMIAWRTASIRFFLAMLSWLIVGFGYIWAFFDPEKLTFHDRYSKTRLVSFDHSLSDGEAGRGNRSK